MVADGSIPVTGAAIDNSLETPSSDHRNHPRHNRKYYQWEGRLNVIIVDMKKLSCLRFIDP